MGKIRVTMTFEYPVDLASYPECSTIEEAVEVDKKSVEDYGVLEFIAAYEADPKNIKWTIVSE